MLLIFAYAASFKWQFSSSPRQDFDIFLSGGAFAFRVGDFGQAKKALLYAEPYDWNFRPGFEPRIDLIGTHTYGTTTDCMYLITIPVWIPFLVFAIPTAWLWYRATRHPKPGVCQCGYDLTGNTSGRCPECGKSVETERL